MRSGVPSSPMFGQSASGLESNPLASFGIVREVIQYEFPSQLSRVRPTLLMNLGVMKDTLRKSFLVSLVLRSSCVSMMGGGLH